MPATQVTDLLFSAAPRWAGKIGSGGVSSDTATTIPLSSSANLNNGEAYIFVINRVTSAGEKNTLSQMETVIGELSGTNFINCDRGVEGVAQAWAADTVVEILFTAAHWKKFVEWAEVEHNQDGTHSTRLPHANNSMYRQALINGNFDVWQRGTSALTLLDMQNQFLADRWSDTTVKDGGTLPTVTRARGTFTPGELPGAMYYTRLTSNGTGTSLGNSSYHRYQQKIENGTRYLCGNGKKVTVSFWARSDITNKRLGVTLYQQYGTGGSPSALEKILSTPITLTSTLTKYTVTFTTNTLSGKTFGTANDDSLDVVFHDQWGTTVGNTDVQASVTAETYGNGYVDIAQVQLCAGDTALPFMPKSFEEELRACQRYFEVFNELIRGSIAKTGIKNINCFYKVIKRATPTITQNTIGAGDTWSLDYIGVENFSGYASISDATESAMNGCTISAEL